MTQQEELALYKAALIDWEKPYDQTNENDKTWSGFCFYFRHIHGVDIYEKFDEVFPTLYKYRKSDESFLWKSYGNSEGRKPRVKALKKAIKKLEKVLSALGEK